jgi:arylsulfatase A-like enzyme
VVIVFSGLDRRTIPPWGPATDLAGLGRLVHDGVAFDRYRAPTTVVSAVFASLLTGLSPAAHGLLDREQRLDDDARLLGERAREGSVRAALFTGVPMTFPAFGFARGWDKYESFSPVKDVAASEPITRATAWIREQIAAGRGEKWLAVIHARGEHPPWDVTREEVGLLPPEEYAGAVEPRGGAIALRNLRGAGRAPVDQRLSSDDWRRLHALEGAALKKQEQALRRLIETLEKAGVYQGALVAFLGDVATGDPPGIPFAPTPPLREDILLAPLLVKFPDGAQAGTQSPGMATTTDLTATIVHALGLDSSGLEGTDLLRISSGATLPDGHPLIAKLGTEYRARWGPWLLSGYSGKQPRLCLVEVDPACVTDAFATSPIAGSGLWRNLYDAEVAGKNARQGRPGPMRAEPDAETQAALKVFGY